ncbi:unnamed protein product [Arctogadus glacialis]
MWDARIRKSWKRRFFTLDDSAVSYYKCETDKEPLRAIQLRDVQKVHECLVKSGDLLLRDNLFEIITSSRVFYVQTDSPEEMRDWIRDIEGKIPGFRGPAQGTLACISRRRSGRSQTPILVCSNPRTLRRLLVPTNACRLVEYHALVPRAVPLVLAPSVLELDCRLAPPSVYPL